MAPRDIEKLVVSLEARTRDFEKKLDKAARNVRTNTRRIENRFDRMNRRVSRSMAGVGKSLKTFAAFGGGLIAGAAGGALFSGAIRNAIEFNEALAEVSTLLPKTSADLKKVETASQRLAKTYGTSSARQVKAFYQAISAGATDAASATRIVDQANRLAVGGVTEIETAVDLLTTAVNAYAASGLTAQDASDALFTGVKAGKTTITELASALGQVVPIAASLGIEFDELVGGVAALTTQGQATAQAVTGLRSILVAVAKPANEAAQLAKKLGLEFNTAALRSKGLSGFLDDVLKKTGGSNDKLAVLFARVEGLNAVLSFAGGGGEAFAGVLDLMAERAGAAGEAFRKVAESDAFQLKLQVNELSEEATRLGTEVLPLLIPVVSNLADAFGRFREDVEAAKDEFNQFTDAVKRLLGENDRLQNSIDSLESRIAALKSRIEQVQKAMAEGFFPATAIQGDLAELAALQQQLENLKIQQANVAANMSLAAAGIRNLSGAGADLPATGTATPETKPPLGGGGGGGGGSGGGTSATGGRRSLPALNAFDQVAEALNREIKLLGQERQILALTGVEAESLRAEFELLNAAQAAGIPVTDELQAEIKQLADRYGEAVIATDDFARAQEQARATVEAIQGAAQDALGGLITDLVQGRNAADSLRDALASVADQLLQIALNNLFSGTGLTGSQAKGGLLGGFLIPGILHGGGTAGISGYGHGRAMPAAAFAGAPRYHSGGVAGFKPGEVPAVLKVGEIVLPKGQASQAAGGGGGGVSVTQVFNISTPNPAAFQGSQNQIQRDAHRGIERMVRVS